MLDEHLHSHPTETLFTRQRWQQRVLKQGGRVFFSSKRRRKRINDRNAAGIGVCVVPSSGENEKHEKAALSGRGYINSLCGAGSSHGTRALERY